MSEKAKKGRISLTLTKSYLNILGRLVDEGIYLTRGEAIQEGIRLLFRLYKIEQFVDPFKSREERETENDG